MSNGDATFHRWITRSRFRGCSTRRSCSEAGLCPCARARACQRGEPTFELLRYLFGGNRPSQTDRLARSRRRIHGARLGDRTAKGGISLKAPPRLAPGHRCLPPMLHMAAQPPMPGNSKGSWGLSVLPQASGIFTGATTSPGSTLRQRPDRYTIRAGRNLPDKEFRYLRTVIVTADIHRGFTSGLRHEG